VAEWKRTLAAEIAMQRRKASSSPLSARADRRGRAPYFSQIENVSREIFHHEEPEKNALDEGFEDLLYLLLSVFRRYRPNGSRCASRYPNSRDSGVHRPGRVRRTAAAPRHCHLRGRHHARHHNIQMEHWFALITNEVDTARVNPRGGGRLHLQQYLSR